MKPSRNLTLFACLIVILLALAGCGGEPASTPIPTAVPPTPTPEPPPTEVPSPTPTNTPEPTLVPRTGDSPIVFVSNREDPAKATLFSINSDGTDLTMIDTGMNANLHPSWSPDGGQIAFWSDDAGDEMIYIVNADGSGLFQVTDFSSALPDWSADGKQLVFQSDHQNEPKDTPDLYIIDITGENLVEILDAPDIIDAVAKWSPDGSQILFMSRSTGKSELFRMNTDGSDRVQVTDLSDPVHYGNWSPDGGRVVFVYGPGPATDLYVMDLDGSNMVRLTSDKSTDNYPAWSPDGDRLVFSSNRSGNWDLWLIDADGENLVQLTDHPGFDGLPDW